MTPKNQELIKIIKSKKITNGDIITDFIKEADANCREWLKEEVKKLKYWFETMDLISRKEVLALLEDK